MDCKYNIILQDKAVNTKKAKLLLFACYKSG